MTDKAPTGVEPYSDEELAKLEDGQLDGVREQANSERARWGDIAGRAQAILDSRLLAKKARGTISELGLGDLAIIEKELAARKAQLLAPSAVDPGTSVNE